MSLLRKSVSTSGDDLEARLVQHVKAVDATRAAYNAVSLGEADGNSDATTVEQARRALAAAVEQRDRTQTALRLVRDREATEARAAQRAELVRAWAEALAAAERRAKNATTLQTAMEAAAAALNAMGGETDQISNAVQGRVTSSAIHAQHAFAIGAPLSHRFLLCEFHRLGLVTDPVLAGVTVPTFSARYAATLGALKRSRDDSLAQFDARGVDTDE